MTGLRRVLKRMIPASLWQKRRQILGERLQRTFAAKTVEETFNEIYRNNIWGGKSGEFFSGRGSRGHHAESYSAAVKKVMAEHDVRTVVDLGVW